MIGSKAKLVYSSSKPDYKKVLEQITRDAKSANIQFEVQDSNQLSSNDEERLLADIRLIPPQSRGQVRSGGGRTPPISGSSKLNRTIPVLIIYDGSKPVDVYPKDLMGVKYDLSSAFKTPTRSDTLGVENSLVTILSSKPEILLPGLELVSKEFDTGSGVIDMIFKDQAGIYLVVEVKEEADQETVGQVLKQSNGFKNKLGLSTVRKAVFTLRTSGNVKAACKDAGVELYVLSTEKQS